MTATRQQLQDASTLLMASDKALIEGAEAAMTTFNSTIDGLLAELPNNPVPMTPATQFALRLRTSLVNQSSFELASLKQQYGMNESVEA